MTLPWVLSFVLLTLLLIARHQFLKSRMLLRTRPRREPQRWPAPIAPTELPDAEDYYPNNLRDVYHTAFLLRQVLLPELVPPVLDHANYWIRSSSQRVEKATVTERATRHASSQEQAGLHYLSSEPIGIEGLSRLHPVRKIRFTITSKDQGWSDYRQWHGTYQHSWTWFEATTRGRDVVDAAPAESRRICTNIHAGKEYETHVITWTDDADDADEARFVKSFQRGHQIDITVWACFPGWTNHVAGARIEVFTAAIR